MRRWVYVLRLVGSSLGGHYAPNWYVGQTNDIPARIQEHWTGQGSKWTQAYPPISVVECTEIPNGDAMGFEIAKFTEYALKYSWQRVRGGSFTRVDSGPPPWWDPTGLRRKHKRERMAAEEPPDAPEEAQIEPAHPESISRASDEQTNPKDSAEDDK